MKIERKPVVIIVFIIGMLMLSACGGSSTKIDTSNDNDKNANENDASTVDYEATSDALAATADAIAAASAAQPTAVPPTAAPATDVPVPTDPPSAGGDYDAWNTDFDSFEEEEDRWYLFTVPGSENYTVDVYTGYLTAWLGAANQTLYVINDYIYMERGEADVLVEIGFDNVGDVRTNNISVVCRASEVGWYEFSLGSDGLWYIWKYQDGSYTLLANGGISGYDWKVTSHYLTAACVGDYLTFAIDGNIPTGAEVSDSSLREGGIGFSISTFDNGGVEVEFDYFYAEPYYE